MIEGQPTGAGNNHKQQIDSVSKGEVVAGTAAAISWPFLIATYTPLESLLKPVEGPIEFTAIASLLIYIAAKANR